MANNYIYTVRGVNIKDLTKEQLAELSPDELIDVAIWFKNEFAANENIYDVINQECINLKNELDESYDDYKHLKDLHNQALKDLDELQEKYEEVKEDRYNLNMEMYSLNRYCKALDEIKEICLADTRTFADGTQVRYDSLDEILNIINKIKEV